MAGKGSAAVVDKPARRGDPRARAPDRCARAARVAAVWLALWLVPVIALLATLGSANVFSQIAVFFSKMAVVTFGGAYAVLAYVAQQAVETLRLAQARRDARRARHGGDHARAR